MGCVEDALGTSNTMRLKIPHKEEGIWLSGLGKKEAFCNITLQEIQVQLAVGSLQTPQEVAAMVRISNDLDVVIWASNHRSFYVRLAAIEHDYCPFARIINAMLHDGSGKVVEAARIILKGRRKEEYAHFMTCLADYPQLSLPLRYNIAIRTED